jgi:hypothetical protein
MTVSKNVCDQGRYILGIWGQYEYSEFAKTSKRCFYASGSRTKIESDIALTKLSPFTPKNITVYCFGEDNLNYLEDQGFNCKLIEKKPYIWDMEREWWRHKIEIIKCGLDEKLPLIYLDWDCIAIRKIPDNIWEVLSKKAIIQTPLKIYRQPRAYWRSADRRTIVEGCFMYFRENVANDIIKAWDELADKYLDETVVAKYIDEINGGWKGEKDYCEKYEPSFQIPGAHRTQSKNLDPYIFFQHIKYKFVAGTLKLLNGGKKWQEIFV